MTVGLGHYLAVAAILFTLGILGIFINRKNVIVILMSIELILLSVNPGFAAKPTTPSEVVGQEGFQAPLIPLLQEAVPAAPHRQQGERGFGRHGYLRGLCLEDKPVEGVGTQGEEIGLLPHGGEARAAGGIHEDHALERR